jgi:amino acid adenylation domain-containing protein/non-ribosomal peptide synthase protein (TIGR01720 family)
MQEEQITTVHFVPSMLEVFAAEEPLERCLALKRVISSGEVLSRELRDKCITAIGPKLHNLYGPTEASVDVTWSACGTGDYDEDVPIGRPISNLSIYMMNDGMDSAGIGIPGELCIGGAGLARGYLGRGDLTAEKFVPLDQGVGCGHRIYRTGDLGIHLNDGKIQYLGRMDQQVKVRGNRVEIGEIEALLREHPGVTAAAVTASPDARRQNRLVGYVVAGDGLDWQELTTSLRERLPAYMLPSAIIRLDRLPLTPSGKIDRKSLPAYEDNGQPEVLSAARNPIEQGLVEIWREVLGLESVGVNADFFELGGHSLLATQVMTRIKGAFQVELPVRTLFDLQTISALGAEINDRIRSGAGVSLGEISPRKKDASLPLSYAQERMWFLDQIDLGSGAYNIGIGVRLIGTVRRSCFAQTVDEVTRRHEALRTRFVVNGGRPEQIVEAGCCGALGLIDLDSLGDLGADEQITALGKEIWGRGFDLAQGGMFRLLLIKAGTAGELAIGAMHHIISDGWSVGLLVREMGTLLRSYSAGLPSPLADLRVQYGDYAVWQREWLQGEVLEAEVAYWRQQLAGSPPVLELPTDRTRPAVQTFRGDRELLRFSPELTAQIKEMCRRHRVTLFMTLLAAFNALLRRHTHSEDIKVGTPIANRNNRQTEDLIGYLANTLVLRTLLSADLTFEELLKQVRETALGAYAHQYLPFEKLVDELQPERDLAYTPLFQVMFTLQNTPVAALDAGDLKIEPLSFETGTAKFDIELLTEDTPGGLFSVLEYNVDLFDAETIRQMGSHFEKLIQWMVRNPKGRVSDAGMLSRDEETQLIVHWNRTEVDTAAGESFDQSFEAQVRNSPDAVAAVFQDRQISYKQLNHRAASIAAALFERGIGRGVVVPLLAERGIELLTAMLAIFKTGAAYVPLDPDHPWARLRQIINERGNGEPLVLTDGSFAAEPNAAKPNADEPEAPVSESDSNVTVLMLDDLLNRGSLLADRGEWVRNQASDISSDLAYVIYTSGSTGVPKGAMVEHGGMLNHLMAKVADLRLTRADTIAQTASSTFDISVWQFLAALLVGGRCHIFDEFVVRDAMTFFEEVDRAGITILEMVPSLVRHALEQVQDRSGSPALSGLRWLIVTGEAVAPELVSEWSDAYPDVPMMNAYGPTECSDDVTHYAISAGIPSSGRVPIGRSIRNTQLYLLDKSFQIVPIGVNGELFVGGAGVGRGYLRDPGRTAQVFVPDAYSGSKGRRLYKTGDLVRRQTDGILAYLGRIDHQIKLRGFRIELGEIESALRRDESVKEAVALVREDEPGRKRLTAYVVPKTGPPLNLGEVRARLRETLPDYMLPAALVVMESLPLTPNGKVDRRALPAPEGSRSEAGASLALPRSSVERTLTEIWRQVLRLEKVGINENFFELGGDSILIIQTISKAKQAGIRLTLRQAFERQTIAELAAAADVGEMVSAEQGIVTGPVPLTPSQLWLLEQGLIDIHYFNQSVLFEVREHLDPSFVYRVVAALLSHHDALRHRFHGEMGWRQFAEVVDDIIAFSVIDLSGRAAATLEDEFEAAISELHASLDLAEGPLIRVTLFNLGRGLPDRLSIIIHHLVVDGISWRILLEDFQTAYRQLSRGEEISLPEKTTSYKQWAERLKRFAGSPELKEEADYWLAESRERTTRLPVDFAQGANTQSSAGSVSVALTGEETAVLLQVVPKLYRTQINDVLLTALVQAFSDWTGKRRLLIDLEGHGRDGLVEGTDVSRTVGWFTAIYPLLLKLEDSIDHGEAMRVIKDRLRRVPNRGIGYGILRYLGADEAVSTELRNMPRAEVIFNYLGQFNDEADQPLDMVWSPAAAGRDNSPGQARRYLLEINGAIAGSRLEFSFRYSRNIHRQSTIERLARGFAERLRGLITHCQSAIESEERAPAFAGIRLDQDLIDRAFAEIDLG